MHLIKIGRGFIIYLERKKDLNNVLFILMKIQKQFLIIFFSLK